MASRALSRSLGRAPSRLVVAYLPSFSSVTSLGRADAAAASLAAVAISPATAQTRQFCSENNNSSDTIINVEISVQSAKDKNEGLPNTSWGPLGAGDSRFPLPGQTGFGSVPVETEEVQFQTALLHLSRPKPSDLLTTQLPLERHVDVFYQWRHQVPSLIREAKAKDEEGLVLGLEQRILNGTTDEIQAQSNPPDDFDLECCFFDCPSLLKSDFNALFPDLDFSFNKFTVITLCQRTKNDMAGWSAEVEEERESLLASFFDAAQTLADFLKTAGFWADFIDPSSGKPFLSAHTNSTMFETDDRFRYLGFEFEDFGCCKVIRHHKWGTHAYVGCVFTTAPLQHPIIKDITQAYVK